MPDTRLIERWLPIAELGIESTRERTPMTPFPAPNRLGVDPILTSGISKLPEIVCVYTTLCRESGTDVPGVSSYATLRP